MRNGIEEVRKIEGVWLILIILFLVIYPREHRMIYQIQKKKKERKGGKRKMPKELIQEFIGKVCSITMLNNSFGVTGKIIAVEENWIKVENKKEVQLINGDMIQNIRILPEKYQNKEG